ncbi:hypothetical protein ACPPVQ_11195 [Diaminobutyricibacter sp. McL0618]|uniref:hypothetical protein n=1 Tax=Leifsonia sp. McL0618 TaxID=3415677 RepID=UPI003CEC9EBD
MTYTEVFDLVDAGDGRWDVQQHGTLLVAGQVCRTRTGFVLWDWLDRQLGTYETIDDALRALIRFEDRSSGATAY